ncbi:MAG TPA: nuclear transport factor 2 family protein [Dehalococcoidales bacterium]|nr:nuclear transport factor 2 family protein [Dehalococcoidales bacterium]
MNRQQFMEYVDHFNKKRFDKVVSYFCPDVTLEYPDNFMGQQIPGVTGRTLRGPQEFIANYEALTANVREVLNVGAFISRGRQFCVELVTEFHVLRTPPPSSGRQWKKGDISILNQIVLYDLDEKGKFKRIRIFHHRHLDPAQAKSK